MLKTPPDMAPYLGKTIDTICQRSLGLDLSKCHCAHFVSHMMEYDSFPTTCKNLSTADKLLPGKGAAATQVAGSRERRQDRVGHPAHRHRRTRPVLY